MAPTSATTEWIELLRRADKEPIGVDLSDYGDEFCAGFLAGQSSILEEIEAGRLVLPEAENGHPETSA